MKRHLRFLQAALATLLLWCALPAVAGELPPLSLADAKAKQAVILDTRASYFYQGWPMEGEKQGGHVAGAGTSLPSGNTAMKSGQRRSRSRG